MKQSRYNMETEAAINEAKAVIKGQIKAKRYPDAHTLFQELDAERENE